MTFFTHVTDLKKRAQRGAALGVLILLVVAGCGAASREMPIVLTYRPSLVGEGQVVQFHSEAPTRLVLNVVVTDSEGYTEETIVSIGPNDVQELGWMELGRPIHMGDTIAIMHDKYRTLEVYLE